MLMLMDENGSGGVPQFATAEYSNKAAGAACSSCQNPIRGEYYRVNGAQTCADCARRIRDSVPGDTPTSLARGILFGVGAALLGLGIYAAFALTTGLMIGYISLAVGYLVGKAIVMGSGGRGGRRYQIAAVVLTYAAVSLAAVPIAISLHLKQKHAQQQAQVPPAALRQTPEQDQTAAHSRTQDSVTDDKPKMRPSKALGLLALIGLASPFLALSDPVGGVIGLIILFVGIRIAWKITAVKPLDILGPIPENALRSVI